MGAEILPLKAECLYMVGDVVYLKSGSPAMTVSRVMKPAREEGTLLMLHWSDNDGKLQGALFPPECLTMTKSDAV